MSAVDAYLPLGSTVESLLATACLVDFPRVMGVACAAGAAAARRAAARRGRGRGRSSRARRQAASGAAPAALPTGLSPVLMRRLRSLQAAQTEQIRVKLLAGRIPVAGGDRHLLGVKLVCPSLFAASPSCWSTVFTSAPAAGLPADRWSCAACWASRARHLSVQHAAKRRQALRKGAPDGLDLLVICAEAGLSLDTALNRVAEEIALSAPELADELALTGVELNFLPERRMALDNLARRADLPAIRGVVNTLIQTEKYGTPLSQSLRVLSAEFRDQRMLRAEEKAARLPAILTVPMILFILPTLFIVLVGPAMIDVYDKMTK